MAFKSKGIQTKMTHAPVAPTMSEIRRQIKRACKDGIIEPKLIAAAVNLSKYVTISLIYAISSETLFESLICNNTSFLVNTCVIEIHLDKKKS